MRFSLAVPLLACLAAAGAKGIDFEALTWNVHNIRANLDDAEVDPYEETRSEAVAAAIEGYAKKHPRAPICLQSVNGHVLSSLKLRLPKHKVFQTAAGDKTEMHEHTALIIPTPTTPTPTKYTPFEPKMLFQTDLDTVFTTKDPESDDEDYTSSHGYVVALARPWLVVACTQLPHDHHIARVAHSEMVSFAAMALKHLVTGHDGAAAAVDEYDPNSVEDADHIKNMHITTFGDTRVGAPVPALMVLGGFHSPAPELVRQTQAATQAAVTDSPPVAMLDHDVFAKELGWTKDADRAGEHGSGMVVAAPPPPHDKEKCERAEKGISNVKRAATRDALLGGRHRAEEEDSERGGRSLGDDLALNATVLMAQTHTFCDGYGPRTRHSDTSLQDVAEFMSDDSVCTPMNSAEASLLIGSTLGRTQWVAHMLQKEAGVSSEGLVGEEVAMPLRQQIGPSSKRAYGRVIGSPDLYAPVLMAETMLAVTHPVGVMGGALLYTPFGRVRLDASIIPVPPPYIDGPPLTRAPHDWELCGLRVPILSMHNAIAIRGHWDVDEKRYLYS